MPTFATSEKDVKLVGKGAHGSVAMRSEYFSCIELRISGS